jgi:lipopolysaccharide transport system ATP-binding protein
MGSLLEVGTGFHPELTGRENVFLNGGILGMSRAEVRRKFDQIVEFSEIGPFLDTPVKRFSSGMYVRLAFAVAAHLDPEILVIDEVLAVGDATFQRRCIDRMTQLAHEGRTILFVSHNMHLIPRLCRRAVLLERGRVAAVGEAAAVTRQYLERLMEDTKAGDLRDKPRTGGDGRARFVRGYLVDGSGRPLTQFVSGDDLVVRMEVEAAQPVENVALAVVVQSLYGMRVITSWTQEVGFSATLAPGRQAFECRFREVKLRPGHTALIDLWMASGTAIDFVERALVVEVAGDERHARLSTAGEQGVVLCDYDWREVPAGG